MRVIIAVLVVVMTTVGIEAATVGQGGSIRKNEQRNDQDGKRDVQCDTEAGHSIYPSWKVTGCEEQLLKLCRKATFELSRLGAAV